MAWQCQRKVSAPVIGGEWVHTTVFTPTTLTVVAPSLLHPGVAVWASPLTPSPPMLCQLALAFRSPVDLDAKAYSLYCQFRPAVASGMEGWGASGTLDLLTIRSLTKRYRQANSQADACA